MLPCDGQKIKSGTSEETIQRRLEILETQFLNRTDRLCYERADGSPCPYKVSSTGLDEALRSHLTGESVEGCGVTAGGRHYRHEGPLRLGTYAPGTDGTTRFACIDIDGGSHRRGVADPLGSALLVLGALGRHGLAPSLESSRGGSGWHVWLFFSAPVEARLVRELLLKILDGVEITLSSGQRARHRKNVGVEVFPKRDDTRTHGGVGSQVWLPWWHGSADGCNEFYREIPGECGVEVYEPGQLPLTEAAAVEAAHAAVCPKTWTLPEQCGVADGDSPIGGASIACVIRWASAKLADDMLRHDTTFALACQLRDNGHRLEDALMACRAFAVNYPEKDHPYTDGELERDVNSAYAGPARAPWRVRRDGLRLELPEPPPRTQCPESMWVVQVAEGDETRARAVLHSCNKFGCTCCRYIKTHRFLTEVERHVAEAASAGAVFAWCRVRDITKKTLHKRMRGPLGYVMTDIEETLFVVCAIEADARMPKGFTKTDHAGALDLLMEMAKGLHDREAPKLAPGKRDRPFSRSYSWGGEEESTESVSEGNTLPDQKEGPVKGETPLSPQKKVRWRNAGRVRKGGAAEILAAILASGCSLEGQRDTFRLLGGAKIEFRAADGSSLRRVLWELTRRKPCAGAVATASGGDNESVAAVFPRAGG